MNNTFSVFLVMSLALAGCGGSERFPEHRGAENNVVFAVTRSRGCPPPINLFGPAQPPGCAIDRPFVTGVNETVAVELEGDGRTAAVRFRSLDAAVFEVGEVTVTTDTSNVRGYRVDVVARRPGVTEFRVERLDGSLVDRVRVEVADAASIVLAADTDVPMPGALDAAQREFRMQVMQRASITAVGVDARERRMFSNDAVRWTVPDRAVVTLSWGFMSGASVQDDRVYVTGVSEGRVTMRATVGAVSREVDAVVTP